MDLRERTAFAAGHLAGSMGFELSRNVATYLGWLYPYGDTALTPIGDSQEQVAEARRELVRIGIDSIAGAGSTSAAPSSVRCAAPQARRSAVNAALAEFEALERADERRPAAGVEPGARRPVQLRRQRLVQRHVPLEVGHPRGEVPTGRP